MRPTLANMPRTREDWSRFSLANLTDHQLIISAIKTKKNVNLRLYQIEPIDLNNFKGWLVQHAQQHTDMNSALGVPSVNLLDLDVKNEHEVEAWVYLHFLEHQTAGQTLLV